MPLTRGRVQGSGFRVQGSGFRVQGLAFKGLRSPGVGLKYLCLGRTTSHHMEKNVLFRCLDVYRRLPDSGELQCKPKELKKAI